MNRSRGSVRFFSKKNLLIVNQLQAKTTNHFINDKRREELTLVSNSCCAVLYESQTFSFWVHKESRSRWADFCAFWFQALCAKKCPKKHDLSSSQLWDIDMQWFPVVLKATSVTHLQWAVWWIFFICSELISDTCLGSWRVMWIHSGVTWEWFNFFMVNESAILK